MRSTPPAPAPAPADTRVPRLAFDGFRGLLAFALSLVPQVGLTVWATARGEDALTPLRELQSLALGVASFYVAYLAMTWWTFARLDTVDLRTVVRRTNSRRRTLTARLSGFDLTSWVLASVATALVLVAMTLAEPITRRSPLALALAGLIVVLAWAAMQISAALLLLRIDTEQPTLTFPDPGPHSLSDHVYLATQLLTTFASSDVQIVSTAGRRAVTVLSISALVFNTVVVALLVSGFLSLIT